MLETPVLISEYHDHVKMVLKTVIMKLMIPVMMMNGLDTTTSVAATITTTNTIVLEGSRTGKVKAFQLFFFLRTYIFFRL